MYPFNVEMKQLILPQKNMYSKLYHQKKIQRELEGRSNLSNFQYNVIFNILPESPHLYFQSTPRLVKTGIVKCMHLYIIDHIRQLKAFLKQRYLYH